MADQQPDAQRPAGDFESGIAGDQCAVWDALVTEDEAQIDPDLLGAYAEGHLSEQERQLMREQIARSPRAMELLDGLHEQFSPPARELTSRRAPEVTGEMPPTTRSGLARAVPSFVAALMLLCALGASWWAVRSHDELAGLQSDLSAQREQLNESQQQLSAAAGEISAYRAALVRMAASTKEELHALAGSRQPFVTEVMSPQLLALATSGDPAARGLDDLSPEEQEQRATQVAAILSPAESLFLPFATGDDTDAVLAWVDILIAAGEWEQARDLLNSAEPTDSPEALNLRAGVLLAEAAELANETGNDVDQQIKSLQQQAKALLNDAVNLDPEFDPAWFNLYQVNLALEDYAGAETALENYTQLTERAPE